MSKLNSLLILQSNIEEALQFKERRVFNNLYKTLYRKTYNFK